MKLRIGFLLLLCLTLVVAGCGGGGGDGIASDDRKSGDEKAEEGEQDEPKTKAEKARASDRENKEKSVKQARKAFEKEEGDVGACRNLAMSYVALASPASTGDPKNPPKPPKDRDKNMKKAIKTLERCRELDAKDRDVQQMLASSYMGTNQYDKAAVLLEDLAKSAKGEERANAYYAWGLAASNAQQLDDAILAWREFIRLAPDKDPRVPQIRQSIRALQAAQKQPASTPAPAAQDAADADADAEG